ncbi:MAG: pantoate--beta-alanine ligase [Bacteroidia bacterium]|nr:pantoate--beta-alanine ligase [Bacteroidia bacterium]
MFVFKNTNHLEHHLNKKRAEGQSIGFVPTMGALHQGHLSLIKESLEANQYTVCSIYVNPTQFNNKKDFETYPQTIDSDVKLLLDTSCNVLFLPSTNEMYASSLDVAEINYGSITNNYEGALRPGHFNGVVAIVKKLFTITNPDAVYFGQKDLQQCLVINKLIETEFPKIKMNIVDTIRETNGLAMSSRNIRLTSTQKDLAVNLFKALFYAKQEILSGGPIDQTIENAKLSFLMDSNFRLEYFDLINMETMEKETTLNTKNKYALIIACWCADVRLIDNVLLTE